MTYDLRNGIKAKQVYLSFTDVVKDSNDNISLTGSDFTSNRFDQFWGAYYGDLTANSVNYSIVDLGFDSTDSTGTFATNGYDSIASITGNEITLSTETTMTQNALVNKWVIVRKANGEKVFARITANSTSTITTDSDLTEQDVAASDTIIILAVPFGLTMNAYQRLDHIATDFTLTPPSIDTADKYFLGSSDSAGSQNMAIDENPPSKFSGSVTVRGGVGDLARLKYNTDTAPTGEIRYNLGSISETPVSFTALWSTDVSDPDATDAVTKGIFCNDIIIKNVGILDKVSADGKAEATIEFEVKGANTRLVEYTSQTGKAQMNV